ncbi:hypothetical protein INS49_004539 [Diaporthe citri]|uniref:uncharacterized protein n=1 Tax=Diaporthe citri TaxID=83186 RepID=UPI001C7F97A8|nr:uncharacterized protein INS49_004539 [Diaporthe citri]KAG6354522.1 hypothetical protein INS49_004539 [Diaporthe citri]
MSDKNNNTDMPTLSERDIQLLVYALRSVEFKKFAEMAGFKNAHSASVSFIPVRRKVMGEAGSAKPTPKKSTPSKRKQAAPAAADSDDADESPLKKAKIASKKTVVKKQQEAKNESDEDKAHAFV